MPLFPPSLLYDRIEEAEHLSDHQKAELNAFAEEYWRLLPAKATAASQLGAMRAFWSLIASTTESVEAAEGPKMTDEARKRIQDLENKLGEQLLGFRTIRESVDLEGKVPPDGIAQRFPKRLARELNAVPYDLGERSAATALEAPEDREAFLRVHLGTGLRLLPKFAPKDDIRRALSRWYPSAIEDDDPPPEFLGFEFDPVSEEENQFDVEFAGMHPTQTLCAQIVGKMLASGEEDMLIELEAENTVVRVYDGTWRIQESAPRNLWGPIQLGFRSRLGLPLVWDERSAVCEWDFIGAPRLLTFEWRKIRGVEAVSIYVTQALGETEPE